MLAFCLSTGSTVSKHYGDVRWKQSEIPLEPTSIYNEYHTLYQSGERWLATNHHFLPSYYLMPASGCRVGKARK